MIPIPAYLRNHESGLKNFSLHFDYFSDWDEAKFKAKVEYHCSAATPILKHADAPLRLLHQRQSAALKSVYDKGCLCLEITARLATPYVSGLGGCHPTETGFILDRNTGLPYIPASSIKGVLRLAHALNLAEQHPEKIEQRNGDFLIPDSEATMRKYFGDTDTSAKDAVRGQLVFLDAFPAGIPTIKRDIMNPHFVGYYKGDNPPVETENPIPVMFMAVQEGIDFKFRIYAQPLAAGAPVDNTFGDNDRAAIIAMFRRAGEELGFGAKTAVGYGRMSNFTDSMEVLVTEWRRMAEEEEARRFPWRSALHELAAVSSLGDFRQKGLDREVLRNNSSNPEVFNCIHDKALELRKTWNAENKIKYDPIIAEWLQSSGLVWPPVEAVADPAGNDAAAELERIKGIGKWVDYINAPANLESLGKSGLKQLREKLKGWGCEDKNAKDDKKTEWERLKQFMSRKD